MIEASMQAAKKICIIKKGNGKETANLSKYVHHEVLRHLTTFYQTHQLSLQQMSSINHFRQAKGKLVSY
jgi:ferritin-like protein